MSNKLTREQIMQIPELKKTQTVEQIAVLLGVQPRTIRYWIPRLEKAGHVVVKSKVGRKPIVL